MTGSIAEAYYCDIPQGIIIEALDRLDDFLRKLTLGLWNIFKIKYYK